MNPTAKRLRIGALIAATALFTALAGSLCAKTANAKLIPVKTAYVFAVPDMPAFWTAWKANAVYATYQKAVASPELKPKMEGFEKQVKTIEAALGFQLDGDTLSQVIKAVDIYAAPGENAGDVTVALLFSVSDKEKLAKLMDLAEKAAIKAAQDASGEPTTATKSADKEKAPAKEGEAKPDSMGGGAETTSTAAKVESEEYKGVTVKKVPGDYEDQTYYAMVGDLLVVTNDRAEMKALIDRSKSDAAGETLAASKDFERIIEGLKDKPGEFYYFANPQYAYDMQAGGAADMVRNILKQLSPDAMGGASVKINPKDLYIYSCQPLGADSTSPWKKLLAKYPAAKDLAVLGYAPADGLVAAGGNLFDSDMLYDGMKKLVAALGQGQQMSLDDQLKQLEEPLGFSIKNDLLAALGNEIGVFVNSVSIQKQGMPEVDAAVVIKVRDKAKMEKVLAGIEKLVDQQLGSMAAAMNPDADKKAPASQFKTETVGSDTVKYIQAMPGIAPGFVISGDYVVIGTNKDGIRKMLELKAGKGEGLLQSKDYKDVASRMAETTNMVQFANIGAIIDVAAKAVASSGDGDSAKPVLDAIRVLKCGGSTTYAAKDGSVVAESVLLLN
jgi:hypothetical protein